MIKILHLADLHIGIENYGRIDPQSGMHTRLLDFLHRLDEAIDLALSEGVQLVLIAGDVYKNRQPNPTHQREFARRIGRLQAAQIPVVIITGNHDMSPAMGRAHAVEIFDTLQVAGVTIIDRPRSMTIETAAGAVQIIAVPWVTHHALLTREEMRHLSFGQLDDEVRRRINQFIERAVADLQPDLPAVLIAHASVDGATLGAERNLTLGKDLVLSRSSVAHAALDYVALGHIHRHQCLGEHPPIVYAGSIERIDFGERNEDKGCVLVELAKGNTRWAFRKLAARAFIQLDVDVRNSSDPTARIIAAIAKQPLTGAVVRLTVTATAEQAAQLRPEALREQLEQSQPAVIAGVNVEVERGERVRLAGADGTLLHGLTPLRALELYLGSTNTDPQRMAALLDAARELLGEG